MTFSDSEWMLITDRSSPIDHAPDSSRNPRRGAALRRERLSFLAGASSPASALVHAIDRTSALGVSHHLALLQTGLQHSERERPMVVVLEAVSFGSIRMILVANRPGVDFGSLGA
jgi:hypothetical protein